MIIFFAQSLSLERTDTDELPYTSVRPSRPLAALTLFLSL